MKRTLITAMLVACALPAWTSSVPEGNYKVTCKNLKMAGNTLQASCKAGYTTWTEVKGRRVEAPVWEESRLDNVDTCAYVENQFGQLACLRPKGAPHDRKQVLTQESFR